MKQQYNNQTNLEVNPCNEKMQKNNTFMTIVQNTSKVKTIINERIDK